MSSFAQDKRQRRARRYRLVERDVLGDGDTLCNPVLPPTAFPLPTDCSFRVFLHSLRNRKPLGKNDAPFLSRFHPSFILWHGPGSFPCVFKSLGSFFSFLPSQPSLPCVPNPQPFVPIVALFSLPLRTVKNVRSFRSRS